MRPIHRIAGRPALGGLLLWQDAANFVRLDWGIDGPGAVSLRGCVESRDVLLGRGILAQNSQVVLRLERQGRRVAALCSDHGHDWQSVAEVDIPIGDSRQVGLFASGQIHRWFYTDAYPHGTAIRFTGLRIIGS